MFSKKKALLYLSKICICAILVLVTLILVKSNSFFKNELYKNVYEKNISFAHINEIYEKYAGSSLPFKDYFINKEQTVFEEKLTYNNSDAYLDGVKLSVGNEYLIPILEDGLVIFIGEKEGYGNTVIVGQSNGIDVWYSNIDNIAISLYDYVDKGELLGNAKEDYFYLVFKKDGQVLNYEDYI